MPDRVAGKLPARGALPGHGGPILPSFPHRPAAVRDGCLFRRPDTMKQGRTTSSRHCWRSAAAFAACPGGPVPRSAGTTSRRDDDKTPGDVLTYGLGLKGPAPQHPQDWSIRRTVNAAWCPPGASPSGGEATAGKRKLVHGVYVTASYSRIYAIDARSGNACGNTEAHTGRRTLL